MNLTYTIVFSLIVILVYNYIHKSRIANAGYFKTLFFNNHLDQTYGKLNMPDSEIKSELRFLLQTFVTLCQSTGAKPVLMYGGLLGWKHNHKCFLPWDDDLDVIILEDDAQRLITLDGLQTDRWLFRVNPRYNNRIVNDPFNKIDARMISKRNGVFIDITFFWKTANHTLLAKDGNEYKVSDIRPLRPDTFEGFSVFVPNNVNEVLVQRYGPNALRPYEWHLQHFGTYSRINFVNYLKNRLRHLLNYVNNKK